MKACATASGGVMFIPDKIERTLPQIVSRTCNDNSQEGQHQQTPA